MTKPRLYMEGESRSVEDIAKTYEKIENVPAWTTRPEESEERDAKDPLGITRKKKPTTDPFAEAKEAAVRMTKFVALCASEMELPAEQTIFAVELMALNTLNAKDCPVKPERINQIRDAAFKYYKDSLSKIPDPK
jgi:hypothetical protein